MPISGARLSSTLNPLSSSTRKQRGKKKPLVSSAAPDLFPDSIPASYGALAPFRLCSRSQPQSSPWGETSEARAAAPRPRLPRLVSRQASRACECWLALIRCVRISPLCPLHPYCCTLLCGSKASSLATRSLCPQRGFLLCGNLSSFTSPPHWCRSHPYSFVCFCFFCFFFFFLFCPTHVCGEFLAFWEV